LRHGGYYDAFSAVKTSLERVLREETPGGVARADHGGWYRRLFGPSVTAGIGGAAELAVWRCGSSEPAWAPLERSSPH
jgi:hypothetical protein